MDNSDLVGKINNGTINIGIIGLGYVGLPLAIEFGKKFKTVGFDISEKRVQELINHCDLSRETTCQDFLSSKFLSFTNNTEDLRCCSIFIVAVPTPVDKNNRPDISPLITASKMIGSVMSKGSIVIYESTVYPGCTEEDCVPVLEKTSGIKFNQDFYAGYSPERINPGDRKHSIKNVVKITSGSCPLASSVVDLLYRQIAEAGTCLVSNIKTAEAAKVIENAQRDINIAFVNELAMIFNKMGLDTNEVLDAASTKWNFLNFRPGLVGGHCIGVDPYYLAHKAQEFGYHPEVILAGRRLNDNVGKYIAQEVVKLMILKGHPVKGSVVSVLGCTFKENCSDARNSRVFDIIKELNSFGCCVSVFDPLADIKFVKAHYGVDIHTFNSETVYVDGLTAAVVIAVAHNEFKQCSFAIPNDRNFIVYDVKGILPKEEVDGRL